MKTYKFHYKFTSLYEFWHEGYKNALDFSFSHVLLSIEQFRALIFLWHCYFLFHNKNQSMKTYKILCKRTALYDFWHEGYKKAQDFSIFSGSSICEKVCFYFFYVIAVITSLLVIFFNHNKFIRKSSKKLSFLSNFIYIYIFFYFRLAWYQ